MVCKANKFIIYNAEAKDVTLKIPLKLVKKVNRKFKIIATRKPNLI